MQRSSMHPNGPARSHGITRSATLLLAILLASGSLAASSGRDPNPFEGYTLFAPMNSAATYLIDNDETLIQTWSSGYPPGLSAYLMENGHLLRTGRLGNGNFSAGGSGGIVEEIDWESNVVWEYIYSSSTVCQHHDVEWLPNGNVLLIAWEEKDDSVAVAAGRDPSTLMDGELWPDHLIEVEPDGASGGTIVWEWHLWDHLIQDYDPARDNYGVVADHPELVDLNYVGSGPPGGQADWTHINSIRYNEQFDQIMVSVHNFHEIWIIDHSTTTAEAAGHTGGNSGKGGDLLYRWGNPQTYGAGTAADQKFFSQHDATWICSACPGAGNILVYNNGPGRPAGLYSTVDEFEPPVDGSGNYALTPGTAYEPAAQTWIYIAANPTDFYSPGISGAQRLPNGNTLICDGNSGHFFEVTPEMTTVWESGTTGNVFKVRRYAPDYPGLSILFPNTVEADLSCLPAAGTVPFSTLMTVTLGNLYDGQTRRVAGRLNAVIAGGSKYTNWKSGWTNIDAGGQYTTAWSQNIPALGSVIGINTFTLQAEDVTPSPFNQPPYPASGDADAAVCTVTGVAP